MSCSKNWKPSGLICSTPEKSLHGSKGKNIQKKKTKNKKKTRQYFKNTNKQKMGKKKPNQTNLVIKCAANKLSRTSVCSAPRTFTIWSNTLCVKNHIFKKNWERERERERERVCVCVCVCEWVSVSEWVWVSEWVSEWVCVKTNSPPMQPAHEHRARRPKCRTCRRSALCSPTQRGCGKWVLKKK